jgi:hypothetical protein|tara:strand:- start:791 stop:1030 length:240 start_codon:yes stop_codon:yes gene_type:complete
MTFEVKNISTLQDSITDVVYEWVLSSVLEYFNVEELEQLSKDQMSEMYSYANSDECYEEYVGMVLRSMCDQLNFESEDL